MIFARVEERRTEYPVAVVGRVPGVSRSGYYAGTKRPPGDTARRRDRLAGTIRAIHDEPYLDTHGSPRRTREWTARGVACCVNTAAKVMSEAGIRARATRRVVRTTDSRHGRPVSESVLDREFAAAKPNQKWVMDLTYVPTQEGWLFPAVVVDLFSRRIVGWATAATATSRLVVDALAMAVSRRRAVAGVIAHSDRGSQYASDHLQSELRRHRMVGGTRGVGQCWDNAVIESTFGRMKVEWTRGERYPTRDEAKASLVGDIEGFYNRARRHSTVGHLTPDEVERTHNPDSR